MIIVIFREQIVSIVQTAFQQINGDSKKINKTIKIS
jgi:hypothetical protein